MFNRIKTVLLLGALSGLMLGAGMLIGGQTGVFIALLFAVLLNFGSYWYSDKMILRMYKAKEADLKEYSYLHDIVSEVSQSANIPKPKVYIVPSEQPNAFATGRDYNHSAVACTEGILKLLDKNELKGVLAHEVSHIKNRDTLIATIAATIAAVISYLAVFARYFAMFGTRDADGMRAGEIIALAILTPMIAMVIQLAISRSREYLADRTAAINTKKPQDLANALAKLQNSAKQSPMKIGSKATASLFIVNPFLGGFSRIFSTHPPMEKRINRLLGMKI